MTSMLFQKRRAKVSLTTATPGRMPSSAAVKSRPTRIGIPAVRN
jgi:hypothetical protein